jgi:hypothetical protein
MKGYWTGEADCPRCGGSGSLLVHGETSTLELDGCWICGFGSTPVERKLEFIPLRRLRVDESLRRPVA